MKGVVKVMMKAWWCNSVAPLPVTNREVIQWAAPCLRRLPALRDAIRHSGACLPATPVRDDVSHRHSSAFLCRCRTRVHTAHARPFFGLHLLTLMPGAILAAMVYLAHRVEVW